MDDVHTSFMILTVTVWEIFGGQTNASYFSSIDYLTAPLVTGQPTVGVD